MRNLLLSYILFTLSLFHTTALGVGVQRGETVLVARQTTTTTDSSSSNQCIEYSRTANLSAIGSNSTFRTAFMQARPAGTMYSAALLDSAIQALPPLTINAALNTACGNLTTIAVTEAARNFTLGIVAEFSGITGNPQAIVNGPVVAAVVLVAVVMIGGTAAFMP